MLQHELQKYVDEGKITVHLGVVTIEIAATEGKVTSVKGTQDGTPVEYETNGVFCVCWPQAKYSVSTR